MLTKNAAGYGEVLGHKTAFGGAVRANWKTTYSAPDKPCLGHRIGRLGRTER